MPLDLSGKKVRLRALKMSDIDTIWTAYQDLDLQLSTDGDAPPISDVQTRAFWENIITDPGDDLRYFAIEPLADGDDESGCDDGLGSAGARWNSR